MRTSSSKPSRDRYIENYCENIRRVAKPGEVHLLQFYAGI